MYNGVFFTRFLGSYCMRAVALSISVLPIQLNAGGVVILRTVIGVQAPNGGADVATVGGDQRVW